ncbi:phospholipid carrier-dependent glycosyltransferase [Thioalkalivibrio denitrificans]|uniref:Phospholipid carrier-dependent glycosyltransferase n=1 Tax=Thioalkalivibrio denitrificans TaxID=108003 RepID=A0A1V3NA12_9GAMM|nr:glycosyltransferase family 39 protein [Thioalkalivibrio denitrificans]OOG21803.1 phospholipid carrier-dependent glycosyltransferase [Thioalkalivibrio denitrificans]
MTHTESPGGQGLRTIPERWLGVALGVAVFAAFFFNLHGFPLFDLDEGAFSEATRDMLARGDYVATYLYGEPRYDKPILIYWLQALSVSAFGLNEFALRLPSALSSTLWMLALYAFAARVTDRRTGMMAAIVGATTLEVGIIGKAAIADALLNLLIAASLFAIYLHYQDGRRRWIYAAFACMGLGFLTKGPVAVAIPFVTSLLFFALRGRWRDWLRAALNPAGIALFLVIIVPWYLLITLREGPGFVLGFLLEHNLGRFQEPMEGHSGPIWYYVPVLLLGMLPWTAIVLAALWRARRQLTDDLTLFLLIWFGFVFVLFSLAGTKLPHYLLYGMTPLFLLTAAEVFRMRSAFWSALPGALFFAFMLAFPSIVVAVRSTVGDPFVAALLEDVERHFGILWYGGFGIALAVSLWFMFERRIHMAWRMTAIGLLLAIGLSGLLLPTVAAVQQGPIRDAGLVARDRPETLVMWSLNNPSFNVYAQRVVERRSPEPGEVALTRSTRLERLAEYEVLFERNGVALVKVMASSATRD